MVKDLTLAELAKVTRRHPETLRRLARLGQLPGAYKIGGQWMIARENARRLRQLPAEGRPCVVEKKAIFILQPNIHGIGVDLKALWAKLKRFAGSRR